MTPLCYALLAAVGNVAGGLIVTRQARRGLRAIEALVAFGAGFILAVALIDVLPQAARHDTQAFLFVLIGYLLVHITQHTAVPHFHFGEEKHAVSRATGVSALIGLLLHTFFDGVAIASGFAVGSRLGLMLFFAVLLHKLPEGVTIASLELASGRRANQALSAAALLGVATVAGVVLHDQVGFLVRHGLALSAGVAIYVGASNLVPEFQAKREWWVQAAFVGGAAIPVVMAGVGL